MQRDEQLKIEHSTLLEEYKALKSEIVSNLNAARQVVNLTLTAIGALIAATPYIAQSDMEILFLVAPIFLYGLAWTQLRYIFLVLDMGTYLKERLIPRIRAVLEEMSPGKPPDHNSVSYDHIMSWESPGKSPIRLPSSTFLKVLFIPIAGSNYGLPLLVAVVSAAAFVVLASSRQEPLSGHEVMLLLINVLAFFYSVFWGFKAEAKR